jgi:hypothetical protein
MSWSEVLATLGGVAGAVFTYLGVRYTGRQAKAAAAITRAEDKAVIVSHDDVERRKDAMDGYETLSNSLLKRLGNQDERITEIELRQAATERKLYQTQRALHNAIAYVERLLDFISAQLPGHPSVPPMPTDVREQMRGEH